MKTKLRMTI